MILSETNNTLSLEHIKYVLGVELTLVESRNIPLEKMKVIVERQIIYESFFSDLKTKIGDIKNKVVTKITDLKDFFVTVARILSTPEALKIAVEKLVNNLKEISKPVLDILEKAKTKIKKLQSIDITNKFNTFVDKIFSISVEWIKFLAVITVGSAFTWIKEKVKSITDTIKTGADMAMNASKGGATEQLMVLLDNLGITRVNGADGLIKSVSSMAGFASNISSIAAISEAVYKFTQPVVDELKAGFSQDGESFELPINENIDNMEELHEGEFCPRCLIEYILEHVNTLEEAEYKGRKVQLGKPFLTPNGPKKRSVYVKNKKGNVIKINFGDPNMRIKKSNPKRRKSFRARHKCDTAKDKTTARYWSCRAW